MGFFLFYTTMKKLPPQVSYFRQIVFLIVEWYHTNAPKPWKKNLKLTKNQIHRVVALDELIIFCIHDYFPKRLFVAVEVLEVCKYIKKKLRLTFFGACDKNDRTGQESIFDT